MTKRKGKVNGKANGKIHFEMQTGIPIPSAGHGNGKYDWPFGTMEVGECFFVECVSVYDANFSKRPLIYHAMKEWRQTSKRFVTRVLEGDKKIGVWRIA